MLKVNNKEDGIKEKVKISPEDIIPPTRGRIITGGMRIKKPKPAKKAK